jgi:6-phosphogluconolactonase (cycloisomerase 2 family)
MPYYMYVSLQDDDKIRVFTMDAETGHLTPTGAVPVSGGPSPLTMSPDQKVLYVGHRNMPAISSFRIDPHTGGLTQSGTVTPEAPPTFLSTDRRGRFLLSAYFDCLRIAACLCLMEPSGYAVSSDRGVQARCVANAFPVHAAYVTSSRIDMPGAESTRCLRGSGAP